MQWFYETVVILRDLLTDDGSIYVHLDWHVAHYSKVILDDVFTYENFRNEIVWYYYNKFQGNINRFASNHDVIFWYSKTNKYLFNKITEKRGETVKQIKRVWDKEKGSIVNAKDSFGQVQYIETDERTVDDVWRISMLQPADKTQNVNYPTQKPEALVERIIKASSNEGDIILDCFCGSGTTAATAEKLGRRWVTCDLGRFAIHTARKRLLGIEGVKPFAVQNLGKYERQQWLAHQFSEPQQRAAQEDAYRAFMLALYHAEAFPGYVWLHGRKGKALVHIGSVDAPVTEGDVKAALKEFWQAVGQPGGPQTATLHVLGWEFAFDLNDTARHMAAQHKVQLSFYQIPREVLEKKAVDQGDITFAELAYVDVQVNKKARAASLRLSDFVMNPDDVPEQARQAITHWSQYVDYWAVDWDFKGDTFHNQWQSYRTRRQPQLALETPAHLYEQSGTYRVVVKVIDILGNDTTKQFDLEIK